MIYQGKKSLLVHYGFYLNYGPLSLLDVFFVMLKFIFNKCSSSIMKTFIMNTFDYY